MDKLNPQQQAAIKTLDHPTLVLAGAGSGKTRVITEKIAHLIQQGLPARQITAVTFTNKAAREMKERVCQRITDKKTRGLRVSTFHAFGLDVLRREHNALGYKKSISIFDEQDRLALIRELIRHGAKEYDIDNAEQYCWHISGWKNDFLSPDQVQKLQTPESMVAARIYADYARTLKAYNAVDFDDLVLLPVYLFKSHRDILEKWQNRTRYLLVDEYQDTNLCQYELVKLLVGQLGKFTAVGDDDQSIYSWRGAKPENLARLRQDFPRLKLIKLEQNYRSSGRILKAANQLISNNPHDIEKHLWSEHAYGDPLRVLNPKDDRDEARQVASDIVHHRFKTGLLFQDYAILYRSNHQSRLLEQTLREHAIPYNLSGGLSFFGFSEVKDILAYLRLLVNSDDDCAFLRIINTPRREIGPSTLESLGKYANQRHISLFSACHEIGLKKTLSDKQISRLTHFCKLMEDTLEKIQRGNTFDVIQEFITIIDYRNWLRDNAASPRSAERKNDNVDELIRWLQKLATSEQNEKPLDELIAKVMLLDILDRNEEENTGDRISLMTLHAAKGLEFPNVYLIGMEENILPHENSIENGGIEEERRLAYVGITRAKKNLTFSYCKRRKRYGLAYECQPSRYLEELPLEDLEWQGKQTVSAEVKKQRGQAHLELLKNMLGHE